MKVILIVVPETLYHEILTKNFSNRLFEVSSTHFWKFFDPAVSFFCKNSGSGLIWKELGGKLRELLELGSSGVVASDVAATQKLHTNEKKGFIQQCDKHFSHGNKSCFGSSKRCRRRACY